MTPNPPFSWNQYAFSSPAGQMCSLRTSNPEIESHDAPVSKCRAHSEVTGCTSGCTLPVPVGMQDARQITHIPFVFTIYYFSSATKDCGAGDSKSLRVIIADKVMKKGFVHHNPSVTCCGLRQGRGHSDAVLFQMSKEAQMCFFQDSEHYSNKVCFPKGIGAKMDMVFKVCEEKWKFWAKECIMG